MRYAAPLLSAAPGYHVSPDNPLILSKMISHHDDSKTRPLGITVLSVFFLFGAAMSGLSFVALLFPGSVLEPMWRLNPRAREGFAALGVWAIILMFVVCVACVSTAVGLWHGKQWGHRLAVVLLGVNLLGDIANVLLGTEPRAVIGIPIVLAILAFLMTRRVRHFFRKAGRE
jgi:multisubunit Na+/H+ antiporter MnhF subunit